MPWNPDNDAVNGQIDSSIKDSPPNPSMINTAAVVRNALKGMWTAIRTQVQTAVTSMDAVQNNFIERSLNLSAVIYVDGVNGNDARTGTTNNSNAATGCVKTLTRVAALHSDKTYELKIVIVNSTDVNGAIEFKIPVLTIHVSGGVLTFRKRIITDGSAINVGEGSARLNCVSWEVNIFLQNNLVIEAHAGSTGLGDQAQYQYAQGAIALSSLPGLADSERCATINVTGASSIIVGNNAVFVVPGTTGTNSYTWNRLARYRRSTTQGGAATPSLGTNSTESLLIGDRILCRSYTPTSSTDSTVSEREIVADNSYIYRKNGGVIKKIAWATF